MTVQGIPVFTEKDKARFWAKVDKTSSEKGCWLWTSAAKPNGYGCFGFKNRTYYAHRIAFVLCGGAFDNGNLVLHGPCHNRLCCNPDHLYSGDQKQNSGPDKDRDGTQCRGDRHYLRRRPELALRGDRNGSRTRPESRPRGDRHGMRLHPERVPRGEKQPNAKLTESKVRQIRDRYSAGGETYQSLADCFGVGVPTICHVVNKKTWAHV